MRFEHVLVVGAGQMGGGIAQVVASSGRRGSLPYAAPGPGNPGREGRGKSRAQHAREHAPDARRAVAAPGAGTRGLGAMGKGLSTRAEKGGSGPAGVLARVDSVDDLVPADLMVEAVGEDAAVKEDVFRRGDETLPPYAVLASNSSSIPI